MRRFLMLVALGALVFSAVPSHAEVAWVGERVMFRASGVPDSSVFSFGAAATSGRTTAPISMEKWNVWGPVNTNTTAPDSILFCSLQIFPTNASGAAPGPSSGDTLYVTPQVSLDGNNWINFGNPSRVFVASDAQAVGQGPAYVLTALGGTKQYFLNLRCLPGGGFIPFSSGARSASTAPTTVQAPGFSFLRFQISGAAAQTGQWAARIYHWQAAAAPCIPVRQEVLFRNTSSSFIQGYMDSSSFSTGATRNDTTAAISLEGWVPYQSDQPGVGTAFGDTLGFFRLRIFPTPGSSLSPNTSNVDTMYCRAFGSYNGQDWFPIINSATNWLLSTEVNNSGCYEWAFRFQAGNNNALTSMVTSNQATNTGTTHTRTFGIPIVRFEILNTGRAIGQYSARLDGFKVPFDRVKDNAY